MSKTTPPQIGDIISFSALQAELRQLEGDAKQLAETVKIVDKKKRVEIIDAELSKGWEQVSDSAKLQRERAKIQASIDLLETAVACLSDVRLLFELAKEDNEDEEVLKEIAEQLELAKKTLKQVEINNLLSRPYASNDAYLDVQFGSGGVESQDWAKMLKRMYVGYGNFQGWKVKEIEETQGEGGIKSATLLIEGINAYGFLRAETGVHRMVRKSPFDSNHRRHTTFASVFVYPVLPENQETATINPVDIRVDTYRASGAGGQHVNTTDSAVRITHFPSGIVVQCQSDRSQHKNRATALSMLRSRLELVQRSEEDDYKKRIEEGKDDISWGQQIRSYVLDKSRVKDLRTNVESGNPKDVLEGTGLTPFIEASLRDNL